MTAAERQRRRRKRLKLEAKREKNNDKRPAKSPERIEREQKQAADQAAAVAVWHTLHWQPPIPDRSGPAHELARQIAEYMSEQPEVTIADVREALDARFGPAPRTE
jgi:hypothetical protein